MGDQASPSVAGLTTDGFVATWETPDGVDERGIVARKFSNEGTPIGPEVWVPYSPALDQTYPEILSLPNDSVLISWVFHDWVYGTGVVYTSAWYAVLDENLNKTYEMSLSSNNQFNPTPWGLVVNDRAIIMNGGTADVTVWAMDFTGAPVNSKILNTFTTGKQGTPSISPFTDGTAMSVWTSDGQDGNSNGIYGQQITSGLDKMGEETRFNATLTGSQDSPTIATTGPDTFIVGWVTSSESPRRWVARRFQKISGFWLPASDEFFVGKRPNSAEEFNPRMIRLASGDIMSIWQETPSGQTAKILALRLGADGVAKYH